MYRHAGEAELFLQRRNGEVEAAVSMDGKMRYGEQPYAFQFREQFRPSCQQQLTRGVAALGERYRIAVRALPPPATILPSALGTHAVVLPRLRPLARGEDPETIAAAGALDVMAATSQTVALRKVGWDYYARLYDLTKPPPVVQKHRPPLGFDLLRSARSVRTAQSASMPLLR